MKKTTLLLARMTLVREHIKTPIHCLTAPGRVPHALLLEVFTDSGVGTMVLPDPPATDRAGGAA